MSAGIVTFLLTDVVASTRLWRESPAAGVALRRQAELIHASVGRHGGALPSDQGEGDSVLAVFARPAEALAAALEAQRALAAEPWPEGAIVAVRMAVHAGEAELEDGRYGGLALIRGARLRSFAHGGQVLVSNAAVEVSADRLPQGVSFRELGSVALPGFGRPERVHQLCHADLPPRETSLASLRALAATPLGHWPTALVGRQRECGEVEALLDDARLVTITGAGGSGKTRLAHAVAQARADRHADGAIWVELARISAAEQVAGAVVSACGFSEAPGASALEVLSARLGQADLLLVLDNCEHVLAACASLAHTVLRACPGVRVLATSREPLGADGETSWRIPSLALPDEAETDPARLLESDAGRLFVERARAARPDFALDAVTVAAVARICRRLDGVPLALELAAARVRALSVGELCAGLDDRFRLLTGGARTAVARQRTLLASVEWSHDLLDEDERALFRRLSVFAAPFSLAAAEAVAADESLDRLDVFELLARLVDKSLVVHVGERYRMLETLRQYALERADDAGELSELRDRHVEWLCRRAAAWGLDREVATERALDEVEIEAPDLIAALDWSLGAADRRPALGLLYPLGHHWNVRGTPEEARAIAARVLADLETGSDLWLEALAPVAFVLLAARQGGWAEAAKAALAEPGREIAPGVRAHIEQALSWGATFTRRQEGIDGLERAIGLARSAGCRAVEVDATARLAAILSMSGARSHAAPLIGWLERNLPEHAWCRFLLEIAAAGGAALDGDFERARAHLDPVRLAAPGIGISFWRGLLALWTEDRALLDPVDGWRGFGVFEGHRVFLSSLPALLAGDLEAARVELARSNAATVVSGHWLQSVQVELELAHGDLEEAERTLARLEPVASGPAFVRLGAEVARLRALLAHARGDAGQAEVCARTSLALALESERALTQVDALEVLALVLVEGGQREDSGRLLGAAEAFRARTGYRWRFPYLRGALAARGEKLEPEALDQGAALSLAGAIEYATRGRGARTRPERGWEGLTPMESRVVELVAAGLPNKEIAKKLFVSLATVKTHLVHVYAKLDVRTRAELASAATRRQR